MQEMDPSERVTNLRLKREMLVLAMNVSAACPGTLHKDYIQHKDELDAMEISEQNESLTEHIEFLQARLQKLQSMPRDSFATPPPSVLLTPASAAPTAEGLKRGRGRWRGLLCLLRPLQGNTAEEGTIFQSTDFNSGISSQQNFLE